MFKRFVVIAIASGDPERGRRGRGDRDAALALLFHPVHHRVARMHFADLVRNAGVKKYPLRDGRFAGIDMRDDADISDFFYGIFTGHKI